MRAASRPQTPSSATPSNTGGQYFDRRGEINELKQALRSGLAERNSDKLRDTIRKVIMYMTLGIDMSRLFSEMVMASQLGDTVQKKMVYLHLTTYAEQNSDLAILAVNTLQKDTKDVDPSVRGVALRSLSSLRLANVVEYLEPAISSGLNDPNGYVRKTAVMSVLNFSKLSSNHSHFTDRVQSMMTSDSDPCVIANCVCVLDEMNLLSPLVDRSLAYSLVNRYSQFSEWARSAVTDKVLSRYQPESEDELFDFLNALDPFLGQTSAPVSFSLFKLLLGWTAESPALNAQVLERITDPLLSLLSASCTTPELQLVILKEIDQLASISRNFSPLLSPHWKDFMISDLDSKDTIEVKVSILARLGDASAIIAELSEYLSSGMDVAANGLVNLVVRSDEPGSRVNQVLEILLETAATIPAHRSLTVVSACVVGVRDILSHFPEHKSVLTEFSAKFFESAIDLFILAGDSRPAWEGIEAVVFLLGEFGSDIDEAPYWLENLFAQISTSDTPLSTNSRLAILTAVVTLFASRPLEVKPLLERVMFMGIEESSNPDVRDAALFYWRVLKSVGPEKFSAFTLPTGQQRGTETELNYSKFNTFKSIVSV